MPMTTRSACSACRMIPSRGRGRRLDDHLVGADRLVAGQPPQVALEPLPRWLGGRRGYGSEEGQRAFAGAREACDQPGPRLAVGRLPAERDEHPVHVGYPPPPRGPQDHNVRVEIRHQLLQPALDPGSRQVGQAEQHGLAAMQARHTRDLRPHVAGDREQRLGGERALQAVVQRFGENDLGVPKRPGPFRRLPVPRTHDREEKDPADSGRAEGGRQIDQARRVRGVGDRNEHQRTASAQPCQVGVVRLRSRVGEAGVGGEERQIQGDAEEKPQEDDASGCGNGHGLEDGQPDAQRASDPREGP